MEGYDGPRVVGKGPDVLGDVAVRAGDRVAAESLAAVPGEEVLEGVEVRAEGAPVGPVLVETVNDVRVLVEAEAELEEVFFCQAAGDVEFGLHARDGVRLLAADEAHQVEGGLFGSEVLVGEGAETATVDQRVAEVLAVVLSSVPSDPSAGMEELHRQIAQVRVKPVPEQCLQASEQMIKDSFHKLMLFCSRETGVSKRF